MAVVTAKSAQITNRDASPAALSNGALVKGSVAKAMGVATLASGDSVGSKLLFCSIPSNAYVSSVKVSAPDIGTTTTMDLGLYQTSANGGAVVDADFFKAAVSLKDGAITKSEVLLGNVITVANMEKRVWEHLALSADPGIMYDVVGTLAGAADGAGAVAVEVEYAI